VFPLKPQRLFDFTVLRKHLGVVDITLSMKIRENLEGLFPAVLGGKPSGAVGEEE